MPGWKFHNRWARKMGLSGRVPGYTNILIDVQGEDFAAVSQRGTDYAKAWVLHVLLDALEDGGGELDGEEQRWIYYKESGLCAIEQAKKGGPIVGSPLPEEILKREIEESKKKGIKLMHHEGLVADCPEAKFVEAFIRDNIDEILADLQQESDTKESKQ